MNETNQNKGLTAPISAARRFICAVANDDGTVQFHWLAWVGQVPIKVDDWTAAQGMREFQRSKLTKRGCTVIEEIAALGRPRFWGDEHALAVTVEVAENEFVTFMRRADAAAEHESDVDECI